VLWSAMRTARTHFDRAERFADAQRSRALEAPQMSRALLRNRFLRDYL
jgi:hypothetical protein